MIEVKKLAKTSEDRPTQWEGVVGDHGALFIRYRGGELEVYVSETSSDAVTNGALVFNERIGGKYEGQISTDEMKVALRDVCRFDK